RLELGGARVAQPLEEDGLAGGGARAGGERAGPADLVVEREARRDRVAHGVGLEAAGGAQLLDRLPDADVRLDAGDHDLVAARRAQRVEVRAQAGRAEAREARLLEARGARRHARRDLLAGRAEPLRVLLGDDDRHAEDARRLEQAPRARERARLLVQLAAVGVLQVDHEQQRAGAVQQADLLRWAGRGQRIGGARAAPKARAGRAVKRGSGPTDAKGSEATTPEASMSRILATIAALGAGLS